MDHPVDEPSSAPPARASIDELDALLDDPGRWEGLDSDRLRHLLFYRCLSYGLQPDEQTIPSLMSLHRLAVARLPPAMRRQVVIHLARAVERVHREHEVREGAGCTNALLPFLLMDPDPAVVSSAAGEMALLLPSEGGDPLSGPRYVRSLLDQVAGDDARAGLLAGLLQLGDVRLEPLLADAWGAVGEEGGQTLALLIQAFRTVHTLTVDFLLSWAEAAVSHPGEAAFGVVAATLARAGRHAAEHGVVEVQRRFPLTAAPESAPFDLQRGMTLEEYAPRVEARLAAVAARESPAALMPHVLSYWGFDAAAFRLAAGAAVAAAVAGLDEATGLCEPVAIDLAPDWPEGPEQETLLEWGVFNPLGPSINTLRLTPAGSRAALVHTLYTPSGTASRVLGLLPPRAGADRVKAVAQAVMAGNGRAGVWLLRSLPDYVHLPDGSLLDRGTVAEGLAAARRAAVLRGEARVRLREQTDRLARLAADPWGTAARELEGAAADDELPQAAAPGGAAGGGEAATDEGGHSEYREWVEAVLSPAHVAAVRSQIPAAWQHAAGSDGGAEDERRGCSG